MTIKLGQGQNGKPIRLDIDTLVRSRMLIQANSGGGKSWAIRRLLEQTYGKLQQIVIDPEGEFYTLREKYDYVLCGKDGDCPAEPRSAGLLARKLLELGCSAILDIYELELPERINFVRLFLESLVESPRKLWHPALIVIDEAHYFAPQTGSAESFHAVAALMSKGRKRGFAGVLATQRLAKLHKDVAAEANNIVIGRTRLDVDRNRAAADLGFTVGEARTKLQKLRPGEFFVFGPAFTHDDVERMRFGSIKSPHPEAGANATPLAPPRAKVKALLRELSDLPAEAKEEAKTIDELRAKVREVEKENRKLKSGNVVDPKVLDRVREESAQAEFERLDAILKKIINDIHKKSDAHTRQLMARRPGAPYPSPFDSSAHEVPEKFRKEPQSTRHSTPEPFTPATNRMSRRHTSLAKVFHIHKKTNANVDKPMQRILDAIGWLESAGLENPYFRTQVAFLARYKPNSGGFNNPLGRLRTLDLISYPVASTVAFTAEGRLLANIPETPLTSKELQERIKERIDTPMWRVLEPLIDYYPRFMSREMLADLAGYKVSSGGFNNPLGRLRTLGLISYPQPGDVIALPVLFP